MIICTPDEMLIAKVIFRALIGISTIACIWSGIGFAIFKINMKKVKKRESEINKKIKSKVDSTIYDKDLEIIKITFENQKNRIDETLAIVENMDKKLEDHQKQIINIIKGGN